MTNLNIEGLDDLRDLESINAWHDLVEARSLFTPEHMMEAIRRKGRDNARTPMQWDDSPRPALPPDSPGFG